MTILKIIYYLEHLIVNLIYLDFDDFKNNILPGTFNSKLNISNFDDFKNNILPGTLNSKLDILDFDDFRDNILPGTFK